MDTYDLELAFYRKLIALTFPLLETLRPDQIFNSEKSSESNAFRRGILLPLDPYTFAFGDGVYSRVESIYQIDIWVPRSRQNSLRSMRELSNNHVTHFFPENGRGETVTEKQTSAHIEVRPSQRDFQREGAFLRTIVEVPFRVDILAST
ncbi:MAG: hypothetical protein AAF720_00885 [Pseudomonadota bacterium]